MLQLEVGDTFDRRAAAAIGEMQYNRNELVLDRAPSG